MRAAGRAAGRCGDDFFRFLRGRPARRRRAQLARLRRRGGER